MNHKPILNAKSLINQTQVCIALKSSEALRTDFRTFEMERLNGECLKRNYNNYLIWKIFAPDADHVLLVYRLCVRALLVPIFITRSEW